MTEIKPEFRIGQRVVIPDAGIEGSVEEIRCGRGGLTYNVEYWLEGEPKSALCRGEELAPAVEKTKKTVGMGR